MSQGKYSPFYKRFDSHEFNCFGDVPAPYTPGDEYDETIHFPNYDSEGYDSYGYSA